MMLYHVLLTYCEAFTYIDQFSNTDIIKPGHEFRSKQTLVMHNMSSVLNTLNVMISSKNGENCEANNSSHAPYNEYGKSVGISLTSLVIPGHTLAMSFCLSVH